MTIRSATFGRFSAAGLSILLLLTAHLSATDETPLVVATKQKPGQGWLLYRTRTLDQFESISKRGLIRTVLP
jgi:hypothetical protein